MTNPLTIISNSELETANFAKDCARQAKNGDIFTLNGTLGMGKSVFARAFIQSLNNDIGDIPSPTFTLVQNYDTNKGTIWHFDLYRIHTPEEIYEIGWEEALSDGIVLIEWPERLGTLLPAKRNAVIFEDLSATSRKITLTRHGE